MAENEPSLDWMKHRVAVLETEIRARSACAEEHRQEIIEKNLRIAALEEQLAELRQDQ
jgi:hypothetical protein